MKRERRACIWLKAEMESLTEVSRFVQEWLAPQEGFHDNRKERYLVELAAIEACTNVIRYAYPASSPGRLGLCVKRADETVEILLLDEGVPFDLTKEPLPDLKESLEGGYGIFLIRKIMHSASYRRKGARWNCLRLVREVPRGRADESAQEGIEVLRNRIVSGKERVR